MLLTLKTKIEIKESAIRKRKTDSKTKKGKRHLETKNSETTSKNETEIEDVSECEIGIESHQLYYFKSSIDSRHIGHVVLLNLNHLIIQPI